ncbi:MAG: TonB-dependent receptor domain-containing protein [Opitutaceae bacterium]
MNSILKPASSLLGLYSGLFLLGSLSAEEQNAETLEGVSLVGEQVETIEFDANSVSIDSIEVKQPDDLGRLFEDSLSVNVNGGKAQAQQIFINNIESTLANVTIDGASQANTYHHASAVLVEPELLKRADVVAGAGSALDGAGALAGAIHFETKNAFDLLGSGETFGGLSKVTGYSNGDGFKFSQSLYGTVAEGWGLLVSASHADRGVFEDGNGDEIENSEYDRTSALVKLTGAIDESQMLEVSYEHFEESFASYDRVNINNAVLAGTGRPLGLLQDVKTDRDTVTVNYDVIPEDAEWLALETSAYYTSQGLEREEDAAGAEVERLGFDVRNTSAFELFAVTYGVDFSDEDVEVYGAPYGVSGTEGTQIFGAYAQAEAPISEYVELSFGARYDHYDYEAMAGDEFQSNQVSPNASLTIKPVDDLSISAGYAEAYRGVSTREAIFAGFRPYAAGTDGEEAETLKLSFNYDDGSIFASGSIFKQEIENYLYPTGTGSFGDIESDGYELTVGARQNGFYGSVGVSYADPEVDGYDYNDDLGIVVAGRRWLADFGYVATHDDGSFYWRAGWTTEYREGVDEVPLPGPFPSVAEKDSYVLHNLNFSINPTAVENLTLALNVDNVFDEAYQDHTIYTAFGLNSPGRVVRLSASLEF